MEEKHFQALDERLYTMFRLTFENFKLGNPDLSDLEKFKCFLAAISVLLMHEIYANSSKEDWEESFNYFVECVRNVLKAQYESKDD